MTAALLRQTADVPSITVQINDQDLPDSVPLRSVEIISQLNRIPLARLVIDDGDVAQQGFRHSSEDLFIPGNTLSVIAGYRDEVAPIFSGIVFRQTVSVRRGRSYLEVECRDASVKMSLNRRNRYHEEVSDSDIAETLIGEYSLSAEVEATGVVHPQLFQFHATDWDFMLSRLEANGHVCAVEAATVRTFKPNFDAEPVADVVFGDNLLEFNAEFDARTQSSGITSAAWNPAEQALAEGEAATPSWDGNGNLSADELAGATERDTESLIHGGAVSAEALQSWADGALLRSRLAASRGRARFRGIAELKLGDFLNLSAISDRFDGKIFITAIRHEYSNNFWFTDIEFGLSRAGHTENFAVSHLAAGGLLPAVGGLQVGVVTQLADDPVGEHRVRVKIPVAGMDEQGVWARVATLDAGSDRGTFFRPEVDDEVVLGFFDNDPSQPVILGMLHSSAKAPPIEPSEDNHEKAYVSREGLRFHFDDDQKIITLETPGGNKLILTDADEGIVLEDQNGNKIEMNSDGIAITSAGELTLSAQSDLKAEGMDVGITASTGFKAEGSASAEVSSSGTMIVKGSLVQIN